MASLKNIAKSVFGESEEEIDRIMALPITGLRLELKKAFTKQNFPQEQYDDFIGRLSRLKDEDIEEQKKIVEEAIQNRKVESPIDIDLSSPAKQLQWAAALTRMMQLGDEPIANSEIWKQLQETITAHNEMITTGKVVYSSLQNDDTSVSWGQPGSWFYFDPKKNHINLDFYYSLMAGFEHIRTLNLHEIGHSQLTTKFTPRMQELYEKIEKYKDPATGQMKLPPEMKEDEQKELALVAKEWELRMQVFNILEDICVDQFAIDTKNSYPQDFGYSKNVVFTTVQGFGELARGDKEDIQVSSEKPRQQLQDMAKELEQQKKELETQQGAALTPGQKAQFESAKKALEQKKKQFEERVVKDKKKLEVISRPMTDAEIKAINKGDIPPELAAKMIQQIPRAGLLALYEANGLFKGREETWRRFRIFPDDIRKTIDTSGAPSGKTDSFDNLVDLAVGMKGIKRLQPQTKDRFFGKDHYQKKVAETTDARIQVMDDIWELYLDKFAKVLMKEFEKEVEQELKQQPQQGQGKPKPDDGQPQQGGEGGGGGKPQPMSESLKKKAQEMKASPEDQRESERSEANDNEGQGEKKDKEAPGGKGWEQDPNAGQQQPEQKVGDLRQQEAVDDKMTPEQKEAMKEAAKAMGKPDPSARSMQGGHSRGLDLAKLAKGDWKDFNRRVLELSPIINSVAESLKKIRDAQKKQIMKQSKNVDYMAEDGDIQGRLDRDKILETKYRQAARMPLKGDDFKKFQEDEIHVNESTIEFFQMIDGSGSMPCLRLTGTTTAMEVALQSAVIMYMACRKAGIDGYIMMWGNPDPLIIATPDSDLKKVGELLETLRNGTSSGTDLAPGLKKSIAAMADHVNKNGTISGSSHVQIYSDGDIFDVPAAQPALEVIARNGKNLTVDVAVLRPPGQTHQGQMETMVNEVIESTHSKMIGIIRGHDANEIPRELARTMLRRVRNIEVKTEPDSSKRKRLKALHRKMEQ